MDDNTHISISEYEELLWYKSEYDADEHARNELHLCKLHRDALEQCLKDIRTMAKSEYGSITRLKNIERMVNAILHDWER